MGLLFKTKKEKEEEKELNKYLDELEKDGQEFDKEEKFNMMSLFEKDPLEEELKQYMTEEQLEEEKKEKENSKRFTILACSLLSVCVVVGIIGFAIFLYASQDELHKTTIKELKNYYNNKYGTHTSIEDIKYICYKNEERKEECTNMVYAKTKDNHIIIKNQSEIGDNNNTAPIYKAYKEDLLNYFTGEQLITNNPSISYNAFFHKYYPYVDYANVLPNKSYNELKSTKSIIVRDFIIYQGDIDEYRIKTFVDTLNDNSEFVLLKTLKGMPINIKIINHASITSIDITSTINLDDNVVNYQLDTTYNQVSAVELTKVATTSIRPLVEGTTFSNTYSFRTDKNRSNEGESLPTYYLISISDLSDNNIIQFDGLSELEKEEYKEIFYINASNKIYILTNNDISIGNASYNKKK